jgi:hypothetical protein
MDLLLTVIVCPGHTISPSIGSQRDWPFIKTSFLGHGTRIDQYPVLNRLSAGVGRNGITEKRFGCLFN